MKKFNEINYEGPYSYPGSLKNISGVYVVVNPTDEVIDIGESEAVRSRVENHDRKDCWDRHTRSPCYYVRYLSGESARKDEEQKLRGKYQPPCGDI